MIDGGALFWLVVWSLFVYCAGRTDGAIAEARLWKREEWARENQERKEEHN